MKLYLDANYDLPQGYDILCRTAEIAIILIKTKIITFISFDHDLGSGKSGYDVALYIEEMANYGMLPRIKYTVHSANPVDADNIRMVMESANKFWDIADIE